MKDSICRSLLLIISMVISQYIYIKIDKKYNVTNKIYLKLPIQNKWIPFFLGIVLLIILTILINISVLITYIFGGIMTGILVSLNNSTDKSK